MLTRKNQVIFRLNDDELALLKDKVRKSGLSQEAFIRAIIQGKVLKEKPDERFYAFMRQLIGLCNNAHQLARKANALGFIDAPMLKSEADKWTEFRLDIRRKFQLPEKNDGNH